MFQRFVAMLLCSCMLVGNTKDAAYVAPAFGNYMSVQEEAVSIEGMTLGEDTSDDVLEETEGVTETTGESTGESGQQPETAEESTEESCEQPETTGESTEESGEQPETAEESTEESDGQPETAEESTEESGEQPETTEESAEESDETPETTEETTEKANEIKTVVEEEGVEEKEATDERVLTVEKITTEFEAAEIIVTLTGEAAYDRDTYVIVYYREKGAENWELGSSTCLRQPCKHNFRIIGYYDAPLKEETIYEYVVGIGEGYYTDAEKLTGVVSGEFTTKKDERALCDTKLYADYNYFEVYTGFTGNTYQSLTYLMLYYREKGAKNWEKTYDVYTWDKSYQKTYTVGTGDEPLKKGTEYEYAIIMMTHGTMPDSPDEVTREGWKQTGTIITKQGNYDLNISVDEKNITNNSATLKISATGDDADEKLYADVTLSNGKTYTVVLCRTKKYTETLKLTNLRSNSKYYVTGVELYTEKYTKKTVLGTFTPDAIFQTKAFNKAKKIMLSCEEVGLNISNTYNYTILYATVAPKTADQDVTWSSSDTAVAIVNTEGKVYPVGVGEAVITAKDKTGQDITATCRVVVRNYVVGQKSENGYEEIETLKIAKNESIDNLILLEKNGEKLVPVEQFDVTVISSNVAKWKDGKLTGFGEGTTNVRLEKEGVMSFFKLEVTEEPENFAITGVDTSDTKYPVITDEDGAYEVAYKEGMTYNVRGQFDSADTFDPALFTWTSSDETVATVEAGVVTPKKAGEVTIAAAHSGNAGTKECRLIIKDVAKMQTDTVYALTNLKKKMCLKDINLSAVAGEGWEWKTPETALYSLAVNDGCYTFEAVYTKTDKYACEEKVKVYVGTFTDLSVWETEGNHNHVIQTGQDEIYLQIVPKITGTVSQEYTSYIPEVKGLEITWEKEYNRYKIKAEKKGKYVLKPEIRVRNGEEEKTILTGKYEIKAVEDAQACAITVTSDTKGVTIDKSSGQIKLDYSEEAKKQPISLKAVVKDKDGNEIETALEWKVTDKNVAAIKYNKKSSHQAQMTVKGTGGSTTITLKAKDATGYMEELPLLIHDISPRVSTTQVTVNMAQDFDGSYGETIAEKSGNLIEVVEAHNNSVSSMALYKNDKKTVETKFDLEYSVSYDGSSIEAHIEPDVENVKPGNYNCQIGIRTKNGDGMYYYPLKIKVVNKVPSVSVKMPKLNLFYKDEAVEATFSISGTNYGVEEVIWEDNSKESGNGFAFNNIDAYVSSSGKSWHELKVQVSQDKVKVTNGKLVDKGVEKGTLYVKLYGYAKLVEIKNYKINYTYKKPTLKTKNSISMISPENRVLENSFYIYDALKKLTVGGNVGYEGSDGYKLKSVSCDNGNVTLSTSYGGRIDYRYTGNGNEKTEKLVCKVDSDSWRETLVVKHTVKLVRPAAKLERSTIVLNKAYKNNVTVKVEPVEQLESLKMYDVEVKGADKKSQQLIDKNLLNFGLDVDSTWGTNTKLYVKMNEQDLLPEPVKNGTYTFLVTPYYSTQKLPGSTAAKEMKLKVVINDKPASVKVTPKGDLNVLLSGEYGYDKCCSILKATFNNISSDCYIEDAKLTGDYAEYFGIYRYKPWNGDSLALDNYYRLYIKGTGKLKAGQNYKLTIEYTLRNASGDKIIVSDNFQVKPKQTLPKVTLSESSVTLYSCSEKEKEVILEVPSIYQIQDIYGGIDCNKDGKADIVVTMDKIEKKYGRAWLNAKIVHPEAITATAKGKIYKVPITVEFEGKDGTGKDAKVNLNVKVLR